MDVSGPLDATLPKTWAQNSSILVTYYHYSISLYTRESKEMIISSDCKKVFHADSWQTKRHPKEGVNMQEEWLPIEGFPDYVVSNYGYVQNVLSGKTLSNSPVQYGMLTVAMMKDAQQFRRSVAGLVVRAFLPPPLREDFNTPIHLDGDRANCRVDNLAWRPRWFAINYHLEKKHRPFAGFHSDIRLMETGEVFDTLTAPATKYGLLEREIHRSLVQGVRVFPAGYTFIFLDVN